MPESARVPDDGREILPELRVRDVLRQRPASFSAPLQIARIALAVTVSWVIGYWISPGSFGIFAPLTTLMVISGSPWSTFGLSVQRILSTAIGVFAATLWVGWVGETWWAVLVAMAAALVIASRLPMSLGGQFQIPASVLFVFALGDATWEQAGWRVLDVVIGGAVGIVAIYLPPPRPRPEKFEARLQEYRDHILSVLRGMAGELRETTAPLRTDVLHAFVVDSRSLRNDAEAARDALVELAQTVAFNPRGRSARDVLDDDALRLRRVASIGVHVRGIAGVVNQRYDRGDLAPALEKRTLADLLEQLADLGTCALGGEGEPVRTVSSEEIRHRAEAFDARVRDLADGLASGGTGNVLESVSLLGRLEYVAGQMEGFDRPPGQDDDRDEDDWAGR